MAATASPIPNRLIRWSRPHAPVTATSVTEVSDDVFTDVCDRFVAHNLVGELLDAGRKMRTHVGVKVAKWRDVGPNPERNRTGAR